MRVGQGEVGPLVLGVLAAARQDHDEDEGAEEGSGPSRTTGDRSRGSRDVPTHERAFLLGVHNSPNTIRNRRRVAGWVTRHVARLGWPRVSHRGLRGARSSRLSRHRVRGGPASGRPPDASARPRRRRTPIRGGSTTPVRASRLVLDNARAATAEALGVEARGGVLHVLGHRGGASRSPRPPPGRRAPRRHHRALGRRALGCPAGGGVDAEPHPRRPRRRGGTDRPRRRRPRGRDRRGLPVRQPRGRHGAAGRRARLAAGRRTAVRRCVRLGRPASAPRRLVRPRGVRSQVGRASGRRHPGRPRRRPLARALPGRRPRGRARERLRERARDPRGGGGAPGGRRGA